MLNSRGVIHFRSIPQVPTAAQCNGACCTELSFLRSRRRRERRSPWAVQRKGPRMGTTSEIRQIPVMEMRFFYLKKCKILKLYLVGTKLSSAECVILKGVNSRHGVGAAQAVKQWLFKELQMDTSNQDPGTGSGKSSQTPGEGLICLQFIFVYLMFVRNLWFIPPTYSFFYYILLDYPC